MIGTEPTEMQFAIWKLVATFIFVLINGFFVAAEFALVKVRPSRMESLATKGNRRARLVVGMTKQLDLYLSACQLGITIASLILGWLAEPAVAALLVDGAAALGLDIASQSWIHPVALTIALIIITMLHITVGEQAPKMLSIQKAEATSLTLALPLHFFATVLKPMIWIINWISNWMIGLAGGASASDHQVRYNLAEVRAILNVAAKTGHLTSRQKLFSDNILGMANLEVRHIMVPRRDVVFLSTSRSSKENLQIVRNAGHSRYPLGDPDLDNIKGVVHSRKLLDQFLDGKTADLKSICRKCPTVPDTQPISRLILVLQQSQTHCALVLDEHGTSVGLAFLEDALEEIVGPIYDEFDEKATRIKNISSGGVEIAGSVPLPEVADILDLELDDSDTVGGFVVSKFKRIPKQGESIEIGHYRVTVINTSRRRVSNVRFEKMDTMLHE